jgi:hypothetical protein
MSAAPGGCGAKKPPRFPAAAFVFAEGSSTNFRPALLTAESKRPPFPAAAFKIDHRDEENSVLGRPGSDLLSRVLRRTTIGAEEFYGRVRDGIGYRLLAETTRPAKDRNQKSVIRKNTDQKLPEASWAIRNGFQRSDY